MKKTTTLTLTIISLLFVFSSSSCNKENDDCFDCPSGPKDTLYIEKDFLDYWYAETGSWWVFKRTDTIGVDIYDTMKVVYHIREIVFDNLINGFSAFEKCDIYFTHSNYIFKTPELNNSIAGQYDALILSSPYSDIYSIEYGWGIKSIFAKTLTKPILSLKYPFLMQSEETRKLPYFVEDNNYNLITIYGELKQTLIINDTETLNIRVYISKNIGISRMELINGEIWELIDCNVIQ